MIAIRGSTKTPRSARARLAGGGSRAALALYRYLPSRPHQHPVSFMQGFERYIFNLACRSQAVCLFGQKLRQLLQCSARAHHGTHLQPMAQKHNVDEGGKLPEEHIPLETEDNCTA